MRRIIRRTQTITIREYWTVVWSDDGIDEPGDNPVDDLPATSDGSSILLLSEKEQTNAAEESVIRTESRITETRVIEADPPTEVDVDPTDRSEPGGLPAGSSDA